MWSQKLVRTSVAFVRVREAGCGGWARRSWRSMWKASPKAGAVVKGPKKAKYCSNCQRYDCIDITDILHKGHKQREREREREMYIYIYYACKIWTHGNISLEKKPGEVEAKVGRRLTYLGAVFHCVIPGFVASWWRCLAMHDMAVLITFWSNKHVIFLGGVGDTT